MSESNKIWEEIKNLPLDLFSLHGQVVSQHVQKVEIPGKDLFIKLNHGAVLPALEVSLGKKFTLETATGYTIVKRAEVSPVK